MLPPSLVFQRTLAERIHSLFRLLVLILENWLSDTLQTVVVALLLFPFMHFPPHYQHISRFCLFRTCFGGKFLLAIIRPFELLCCLDALARSSKPTTDWHRRPLLIIQSKLDTWKLCRRAPNKRESAAQRAVNQLNELDDDGGGMVAMLVAAAAAAAATTSTFDVSTQKVSVETYFCSDCKHNCIATLLKKQNKTLLFRLI